MPTVYPSAFGPTPQFENQAGEPAVGDKIFLYIAGSNTKTNSYTDPTGTVANTNPIILNSYGMPPNEFWWPSGMLYKVVWAPSTDTDPPSSPIRTWDNLSGIGDSAAITISEWVQYTAAVTYISATSFSVVGDQTSIFQIGRRVRTTNSGGTVYSTITNSVFGALTTVTLSNDAGALDSGLSAVYYGILSASNPSYPNFIDSVFRVVDDLDKTKRLAMQVSSITTATTRTWTIPDRSGIPVIPSDEGTEGQAIFSAGASAAPLWAYVPDVRQTVLNAAVDSSGLANYITGVGLTTLTVAGSAATPLVVTAANGPANRTGTSTANLTLAGETVNGTYYDYIDISSAGVMTLGKTSLAPVYQRGGTYSTTNGQFTFNYLGEMIGKVGNGSVATQTYRVFIGEHVVAGNVISTITQYALRGRYASTPAALAFGGNTSFSHNIGTTDCKTFLRFINTTTELGYAVGDIVDQWGSDTAGNYGANIEKTGRNSAVLTISSGGPLLVNRSTFAPSNVTAANWNRQVIIERDW